MQPLPKELNHNPVLLSFCDNWSGTYDVTFTVPVRNTTFKYLNLQGFALNPTNLDFSSYPQPTGYSNVCMLHVDGARGEINQNGNITDVLSCIYSQVIPAQNGGYWTSKPGVTDFVEIDPTIDRIRLYLTWNDANMTPIVPQANSEGATVAFSLTGESPNRKDQSTISQEINKHNAKSRFFDEYYDKMSRFY